jgi:hypothetical protein
MIGIILIIKQDFADGLVLESSSIEISQETLLAICILLLLYVGRTYEKFKIFNLALAGVLTVHFVREFDFWLNYNLFDNSWQVFALVFVIAIFYLIFKNFNRFVAELYQVSKTYSFGIFLIGFIILHVFSRLFGSKKIWNVILEPGYLGYVRTEEGEKVISFYDYVYPVKAGVQESVELLAYALICIGVMEMIIFVIKSSRNSKYEH